MRVKRDLTGIASKCFGTAVLALALVGLQRSLWYFRPQLAGKIPPSNQNSVVSTYGSNRKLLQFNFSLHRNATSEFGNALKAKECSELRHLKSSEERCKFVKSSDSCEMDDGFIQYIQIPYCSFPHLVPLAFVLLALWLVFLFITLGLTADDYFCPSLTVISKTIGLSQNIAGVTFLAYGNGAPDIFSALAALSHSKSQNGVQLGIQALFGAGMFVTTVVVGVISFISTVTLTTRPFIRDVLFYLGAVAWTFLTLYKENITLGESIGFVVFYVAYILVVIIAHFIYQGWKRKLAATEKFLESQRRRPAARKMMNSAGGSVTSSVTVNSESNDVHEDSIDINEPLDHTLSDALFATENTFCATAIHSIPKVASIRNSSSVERIPLLGGRPKISAWRKFLQGLEPIDREEWSQSSCFWKVFIICKLPAVFFLNLTVPVVDYDEEDHNWNKWLNVLHCITMPVFGVMATKGSNILIGGRFPAWALALCAGIILALIVGMVTRSDKRPRAHFLFAYLAFAVSVIWIYTTANEIVNLLQVPIKDGAYFCYCASVLRILRYSSFLWVVPTYSGISIFALFKTMWRKQSLTFGIVFGLSDAILGLTFLAWGNSIGDLVSNPTMARQGFSRMAVSACFGGPLLNMLLGIGISCTVLTISRGDAIPLRHRYNQYVISAGFLAASLSSSAIIIPLMGFKVPRIYGVYLMLLYLAYLTTSIVAEIKHI